MILSFEQIQAIVTDNPNKSVIAKGQEMANKLMLHLHGMGMDAAIKRCDHFVSEELFKVQKDYAISNKDLFSRLLQQEDMVFSARGGSTHFHMADSEENQMNEMLDNVRYGMNLRKWVQNFALQAFRADPMGVIFMEVEPMIVNADGTMNEPKAYPTYKSIHCIYDYQNNGRQLEYICFKLKKAECIAYGITDEELKALSSTADTSYFRIVDDKKDVIVRKKDGHVSLVTNITQKNPIANPWNKTPGFVISNLIRFNNTSEFVSPLDFVIELADCFLNDRSVRDLQKKYHGFAKAIEPLLTCPTCMGEGYVAGSACPSCTVNGAPKGSGYKLKTKVSDVAKFPLEILESGSFDFRKIFGYISPDIDGWEKQDSSLEDLEEMMEMTYWGTVRMRRPQPGKSGSKGEAITATESNSNEAPKEARLNITADWAETTENMIADFIGKYWFEASWKRSSISYGRDYILKTADELMDIYQSLRSKGAPDFSMDEALEKYYRARYQNNPVMMVKYLKMLDVEPFPHMTALQAKNVVTDFTDFNCKLYFGEWSNTIPEAFWINKKPEDLRVLLKDYVTAKAIKEPAPAGVPLN